MCREPVPISTPSDTQQFIQEEEPMRKSEVPEINTANIQPDLLVVPQEPVNAVSFGPADDDDDDYLYVKSGSTVSALYQALYDDDDDDDRAVEKTAYLLPLKNCKSDPSKQTYIKLKKSSVSLRVGGKYKISAAVRNPKGKTTYSSSNKKVAKVSSKGVVTALKKGKARITVKNNGVKRTFNVKVNKR